MSIFDRFRRKTQPDEQRATGSIAIPEALYRTNRPGSVTPDTALTASAVYSAVRLLSESVASLPLITYRRLDNGGKERATGHYLYPVLHDIANPFMTAFTLRETLVSHVLLWGNAYANIEIDNAGRVVALWPLRPDRMSVDFEGGRLSYSYQVAQGESALLPSETVLHIRGLSSDGITGLAPIALARRAINLALATESYGALFFENGGVPGTVLKHPGKLSTDAHKRLRETYEDRHTGLDNAHRVAVLEEGMSIEKIGIPPEDAQFLATRQFQVSEIARIFRVPPHMIGDLDRATFGNIEQMSLEFVIYSLRPWLVRLEQELNKSLLLPSERPVFFIEHMIDGLLRGDSQSRYAAYSVGRQNGFLSANDIRGFENLNPIEGGDVYLMPLNMSPVGPDGLPVTQEQAPTVPTGPVSTARDLHELDGEYRARSALNRRRSLAKSYERVYRDTFGRILRREANDLLAQARKVFAKRSAIDAETRAIYNDWIESFYREHKDFIARNVLPVALAYGELVARDAESEASAVLSQPEQRVETENFTRAYVDGFANRHIGAQSAEVRNALDRAQAENTDPVDALGELTERWITDKPATLAGHETNQTGNAIAKAVFTAVGIKRLRWHTFADNCPYCRSLNNRTVEIEYHFIGEGESFQPEGVDVPLKTAHKISHPPAHKGCDCYIGASL